MAESALARFRAKLNKSVGGDSWLTRDLAACLSMRRSRPMRSKSSKPGC